MSLPVTKAHKRAKAKAWRKANPEKIALYQSRYRRKRYNTEPAYKVMAVSRVRMSRAIKYAGGDKGQKSKGLLGCSPAALKAHIESLFKPGMSWNNHGYFGWHIDHIKPCSSFDLTDPEQQNICFHYTNLQPLWREENMSKSDKFLVAQ